MTEGWTEKCRDAVQAILARRGWELAEPDDLAQAVCDALAGRPGFSPETIPATVIERATIHHYCFVLYNACAQAGSYRQRRAFQELWQHLYRVALYKTHQAPVAQDCTQQALVNIWRHLDQCEDRGSFIGWCDQVLLNVIREYFRKQPRQNEEGDEWVRRELDEAELGLSGELSERGELELDRVPIADGYDQAVRAQMREQLIAALRECLRSEQHERVIVELFLNDKSTKQVADEMRTTPGNVLVMKTRALKKLKTCEPFNRLYEEWLK